MSRAISIETLPMSAATRRLNAHLGLGQGMAKAQTTAAQVESPKKRLRQSSKPLLNANEQAFEAHLKGTLPMAFIWAQAVHLQLANGTRYTPDFVTYEPIPHGRLVAWEVKGKSKIFDGAGEKLKVAATKFRGITFYLVWFEGGVWQQQRILP